MSKTTETNVTKPKFRQNNLILNTKQLYLTRNDFFKIGRLVTL